MSYKKDMEDIGSMIVMAGFREDVRKRVHQGGTEAIVSSNNDFSVLVRCEKEDTPSIQRRVSSLKKAKVERLADDILKVMMVKGE